MPFYRQNRLRDVFNRVNIEAIKPKYRKVCYGLYKANTWVKYVDAKPIAYAQDC